MNKPYYEHELISYDELPIGWRNKETLQSLEQFLQLSWDQRRTLYFDSDESKKQRFIDFDHSNGIKLSKYIGTIAFKGETITVLPKVYRQGPVVPSSEDLIKDILLWLNYCYSAKYPFINMPSNISDSKDSFEIFSSIYLRSVEEAIRKQAFFNYEDVTEIGTTVKGRVNYLDYAVNKVPRGQNHLLEYTYSGFQFDNKVNRIIKATCLLINKITKNNSNRLLIRKILAMLEDVADINCSPSDCDTIAFSNPQSSYKVIMQLSKMFLLNKTTSGINGRLDSFCFLFPTDLLFEGFVAGYLKEKYHNFANVKIQSSEHYLADTYKNDEYLGKAFQLREDIILDTDEFRIVLDTKYKLIDSLADVSSNIKLGISDSDLKQMVIYALENDASELYLVYPLPRHEKLDKDEVFYRVTTECFGKMHAMDVHILRVPFTFSEDSDGRMRMMKEATSCILDDYVRKIVHAAERTSNI